MAEPSSDDYESARSDSEPVQNAALVPSSGIRSNALQPPPESQTFSSLDSLIEFCDAWTGPRGYALSKARVQKVGNRLDGQIKGCMLYCHRGHAARPKSTKAPPEVRKRNSTSDKTDCPMRLKVRRVEGGIWRIEYVDVSHNHDPLYKSIQPAPIRRRALLGIEERLRAGLDANASVDQIYRSLKADIDVVTKRDVYNMIARLKREARGETPLIQKAVALLDQGPWVYRIWAHPTTYHVSCLAFVHRKSLTLLKSCSDVLFMTCSYDTNKFNMPLFEITGISKTGKAYAVCQAFIRREDTDDYLTVLRWLRRIFHYSNIPTPRVIHINYDKALMKALEDEEPIETINGTVVQHTWSHVPQLFSSHHAEQDIEKHCRAKFRTTAPRVGRSNSEAMQAIINAQWTEFWADWSQVLNCKEQSYFPSIWGDFTAKWAAIEPDAVRYISDTWISVKEKVFRCFTNRVTHFNTSTTPRSEVIPEAIKKAQTEGPGHFLDIIPIVQKVIDEQLQQINYETADAQIKRVASLSGKPFQNLSWQVAHDAIRAISENVRLLELEPLKPCTGLFTQIMGLPCAHRIFELQQHGISDIPLDEIDPHWRLDTMPNYSFDVTLLLQEPIVLTRHGYPVPEGVSRHNHTSSDMRDRELEDELDRELERESERELESDSDLESDGAEQQADTTNTSKRKRADVGTPEVRPPRHRRGPGSTPSNPSVPSQAGQWQSTLRDLSHR